TSGDPWTEVPDRRLPPGAEQLGMTRSGWRGTPARSDSSRDATAGELVRPATSTRAIARWPLALESTAAPRYRRCRPRQPARTGSPRRTACSHADGRGTSTGTTKGQRSRVRLGSRIRAPAIAVGRSETRPILTLRSGREPLG